MPIGDGPPTWPARKKRLSHQMQITHMGVDPTDTFKTFLHRTRDRVSRYSRRISWTQSRSAKSRFYGHSVSCIVFQEENRDTFLIFLHSFDDLFLTSWARRDRRENSAQHDAGRKFSGDSNGRAPAKREAKSELAQVWVSLIFFLKKSLPFSLCQASGFRLEGCHSPSTWVYFTYSGKAKLC